jgi:DNA-binding MarR family transcriptional regulator
MSKKRREEWEDLHWAIGICRRPLALSPPEQAADTAIEQWAKATRFRRDLERALGPHSLTFALWRVLHIADRIIRETDDAVSQTAIANRTGLKAASVSYVMKVLAERNLIDRAPDMCGTAWRIYLTDRGRELLASSRTIALEHGYLDPP